MCLPNGRDALLPLLVPDAEFLWEASRMLLEQFVFMEAALELFAQQCGVRAGQ
jgi:hypothetical protein